MSALTGPAVDAVAPPAAEANAPPLLLWARQNAAARAARVGRKKANKAGT